jgi:hypothetical protein
MVILSECCRTIAASKGDALSRKPDHRHRLLRTRREGYTAAALPRMVMNSRRLVLNRA